MERIQPILVLVHHALEQPLYAFHATPKHTRIEVGCKCAREP